MLGWLQITSGRGPAECAWVVGRVLQEILKHGQELKLDLQILETTPGEHPDTYGSVLLSVEGQDFQALVSQWQGTIQWRGESPYRPHYKRKNWFVGVTAFVPDQKTDIQLKDIQIECMRASGPGGQHVNKTSSAVRVTHKTSGLSAVAQEERSQTRNRKLALCRLTEKINQQNQTAQKTSNRISGMPTTASNAAIRVVSMSAATLNAKYKFALALVIPKSDQVVPKS